MARHLPSDGPVDDVFAPISALFSDVAAEWTVGTELWSALRTPCLSLLRDIHEGIDIPRATLAVTPARPFMKEFKATRAIEAPLREVIARHQATGCFPVLDRILTGPSGPLPTEDQAWMLLYVLWNATIYPGSYGAWAYADVWQHPEWHQGVLALQSATERQARYADAFQETVRLWPVASLVRALSEPVEVMSNGCTYSVGPGDVLGVFPWSRNRDPDRHSEPEQWDADRWTRHESSEGLFGRGAFGCGGAVQPAPVWRPARWTVPAVRLPDDTAAARPPLPGAPDLPRTRVVGSAGDAPGRVLTRASDVSPRFRSDRVDR